MKPHRSLTLLLIVLVVACGGGPFPVATETTIDTEPPETVTEDSTFHHSPFLCQLPIVLRQNTAALVGQVAAFEGPLYESFTGLENREYWDLIIAVDEVVPGSIETAIEMEGGNNPMPALIEGEEVTVMFHPDNGSLSFNGVKETADASGQLMVLLAAGAAPNKPSELGYWGTRRAVAVADDGSVTFIGACGDELDAELAAVAEALDRKPDLELLVDFQAEVLSNYGRLDDHGPIETTAYELPEPEPETTLPGQG